MELNVVPILFSSCACDTGLCKGCGCAFMYDHAKMFSSNFFLFDLIALNIDF